MVYLRAVSICFLLFVFQISAAPWSWTWTWPADKNAKAPEAVVCEFKYGKDWAYAVEIDDGPIGTETVVYPLLAKHYYTDAPTGVKGGKQRPFTGGTAIIVNSIDTGNSTIMQWDNVHRLLEAGWRVVSHSYAHRGRTWGKPPELLSSEEFHEDLFWSQAIYAFNLGGRAPTSIVYPNGYAEYGKYGEEFGLYAGSRVSAGPANPVYDPNFNFFNLTRSYLDEGYWANSGKGDPMAMFPAEDRIKGLLHIDFTHGISTNPVSANYLRWTERLSKIEALYGAKGKDSMWAASTCEVIDYVLACKSAKLDITSGQLSVRLPNDRPGSSLTVCIKGIAANTKLQAPEGGVLYREGDTVWVTSPMIGLQGSAPPKPSVTRIYSGPVQDVTLEKPFPIAAVRILQASPPPAEFEYKIDVVNGDTVTTLVAPEQKTADKAWWKWKLFSVVPNKPPVVAKEIRARPDKSLKTMEIWAVQ